MLRLPAPTRLTVKETDELFMDVWYKTFPDSYDYLWCEDIDSERLISDLVDFYPDQYKKLLDLMEEEAKRRGLLL